MSAEGDIGAMERCRLPGISQIVALNGITVAVWS